MPDPAKRLQTAKQHRRCATHEHPGASSPEMTLQEADSQHLSVGRRKSKGLTAHVPTPRRSEERPCAGGSSSCLSSCCGSPPEMRSRTS